MNTEQRQWIDEHSVYYGDIHNHSGISYGHGKLEDALTNGRTQLDFCSVTGHYSWPDMGNRTMAPEVAAYHHEGFEKFRKNRGAYMEMLRSFEKPESFIPFVSFEIHSFEHGDYTILAKDFPEKWPDPLSSSELAQLIAASRPESGFILVPHHIGYKTGFRGINWNTFNEKASPLVEIVSMHGGAESHETSARYLHTMGPRDMGNTMQGGLAAGHHFGVTGSTDHHNSFPGSYGYGRTGVWSRNCSREALWEAFIHRRTFALTGDRMELALFVNDAPVGSICSSPYAGKRAVTAAVTGGFALERVELVKNNAVIYTKQYPSLYPSFSGNNEQPFSTGPGGTAITGKVPLQFGWGEKGVKAAWEGTLRILDGTLLSPEPRFRGQDLVDPLDGNDLEAASENPAFSWDRDHSLVSFSFVTRGNSTASTDNTQQISLEIEGTAATVIAADISVIQKGKKVSKSFQFPLRDLPQPVSAYVDGFISPAVLCGAFMPAVSYTDEFTYTDEEHSSRTEDWYYLRVLQRNGQAGWTSPIWVSR